MTHQIDDTAVRLDIVVDAPAEHAFRVFTEQYDQIKPRDHNLLEVPIVETVLEPRVGGYVFDRGEDGSVCRWARVLAYEPPERLVISWDISPQWQLETDPEHASEVEVRFVPLGPAQTRVELEHLHLDRHGPDWPGMRESVSGEGGWPLYLHRYADLVAGRATD